MNRIWAVARRFNQLTLKQKVNVLRIILLSIWVKIIIILVPMRFYYRLFLIPQNIQIVNLQPFIHEIRLIKRVTKNLPWQTSCLNYCMLTKLFLRKFDIDLPIYLGVKSSEELKAHAWCWNEDRAGFENNIFL